MLEKAAAAGKKFMMSVNDAWYIYSFYAGAGLVATLAEDGINTVCNWNEAPGADVTQAILDITANPGFKSGADADIALAGAQAQRLSLPVKEAAVGRDDP